MKFMIIFLSISVVAMGRRIHDNAIYENDIEDFEDYGRAMHLFQGHAPRDPLELRPQSIHSPLPRSPVPKQWNWNDVNGVNYLTILKNQHIPNYCGSCWAQAAASSLSDRIKIVRKAQWPDINISPQVLISCGPGDGCHGGDAGKANEWMAKNGITDETCSIYQARGHDNGAPCTSKEVCETCWPGDSPDTCKTPKKYLKYAVDEYADIEGDNALDQESNMMKEIFHRGPISCGISVTEELVKNYTGGVFKDKTGAHVIDHDISVVGYGVENGENYWLIRNSWGSYWGENGFFKLARGINNLGIESGTCSWATPLKTWSNHNFIEASITPAPKNPVYSKLWDILADFILNYETQNVNKKHRGCSAEIPHFQKGPKIIEPMPSETISDESLPKNWDWRNVNGTNYLSWNVNQHIPVYCGSCWAQGTLSALADRFIIADRKKYANLAFAVQTIINCRAGGSCEGGNPAGVYEFVHDIGVPDFTCQVYEAKDHGPVKDCSKPNIDVCRDCTWPPPKLGQLGNCWAKQNFKRYFVTEYGPISGATNMKKEIMKRGPIGCGIDVTEKFENYSGGIFRQHKRNPMINHELSIVGWGTDPSTGEEYWIGRNSWGTYWGEYGFFKIAMYDNNLAIETACIWAVPKIE